MEMLAKVNGQLVRGEFLGTTKKQGRIVFNIKVGNAIEEVEPSLIYAETEATRQSNPKMITKEGYEVNFRQAKPSKADMLSSAIGEPVRYFGKVAKEDPYFPGGFWAFPRGGQPHFLGKSFKKAVEGLGPELDAGIRRQIYDGRAGDYLLHNPELAAEIRSGIFQQQTTGDLFERRAKQLEQDALMLGYQNGSDLLSDLLDLGEEMEAAGWQDVALRPRLYHYLKGNASTILLPRASGGIEAYPVVYVLAEANELTPSHLPTTEGRTFPKNPLYPEGIQERAYHGDPEEASKVKEQAKNLIVDLIINEGKDGLNGPPVMDKNGLVLGGNSRAMTLQLAYKDPAKANQIKQYLRSVIGEYGFLRIDLDRFAQPVIARMIDFSTYDNPQEAISWVRRLNVTLTQTLDPARMLTAASRAVTAGQWQQLSSQLAADMSDEETLNSFLLESRSLVFVGLLFQFGIFTTRTASAFQVEQTGLLNRYGRRFVQDLFVGHIFADFGDDLSRVGDGDFAALATWAPSLILAACCDHRYDLREDFVISFLAARYARDEGARTEQEYDQVMGQISLFGGQSAYASFKDKANETPLRRILTRLIFVHGKQINYMAKGFKRYAARVKRTGTGGQEMITGIEANDPLQDLCFAFGMLPYRPNELLFASIQDMKSADLYEPLPVWLGYGLTRSFGIVSDYKARKSNPSALVRFPDGNAIGGYYNQRNGRFYPYDADLRPTTQPDPNFGDPEATQRLYRANNLLQTARGALSVQNFAMLKDVADRSNYRGFSEGEYQRFIEIMTAAILNQREIERAQLMDVFGGLYVPEKPARTSRASKRPAVIDAEIIPKEPKQPKERKPKAEKPAKPAKPAKESKPKAEKPAKPAKPAKESKPKAEKPATPAKERKPKAAKPKAEKPALSMDEALAADAAALAERERARKAKPEPKKITLPADTPLVSLNMDLDALTEVPVWGDHARNKNWLAKVERDPKKPSGLDRKFFEKGKGSEFYYIVPQGSLKTGDVVEFGADYYTGSGRKSENRWFGVVLSLTPSALELAKAKSQKDAFAISKGL